VEGISSLIFLGLLIAVFYFFLIRPQRRRVEAHKALVRSLSVGDEVVTIGGLHGRVKRLMEEDLELEVASNTTLRFVKSAIARKVSEEAGSTGEEEQ
jgi:preprotein translocase subunit YajC